MKTLIVHPKTLNELKKIQEILKNLKVNFEIIPSSREKLSDETDYLNASISNKKRLEDSIKNVEKGNVFNINIEDICK